MLDRVVADPVLHARFVNTLSRMEYIGVRKMLKARQADLLDEEGLLHIIEEASHALRLKRAALLLGGQDAGDVRTYSDEHTLAGQAGEDYMQGVDRGCEELLASTDLEAASRCEANYLLSTAAIEIRAEAFYPLYEQCLQAAGAPFSVKSILKDELRHLEEMRESLGRLFPDCWRQLVSQAVALESTCFERWLEEMQASSSNAKHRKQPQLR